MALTTLTPVSQWDDVKVPNNGTKMVAVSATDPPPNDEGPVRQAFQQLVNRTKWLRDKILAGTRTFKALKIDGAGDQEATPPDGSLSVSGGVICGGSVGAVGPVSVTAGTDQTTIYPSAVAWTGTTAAANPAHTVSVANKMLAINTTKVICFAEFNGGALVAAGGCGWTAADMLTGSFNITFATPFDDTNYSTFIYINSPAEPYGLGYKTLNRTQGGISIVSYLGSTIQDMRIGLFSVNLMVCGKVTT